MPWQLPTDLVNETTGLLEGTAKWAYNVTFGTFWTLLLLGFCVVLGMTSYRYGQEKAVGYACIAGLFGSLILVTLKLMPWWIASLFILAGCGGLAYMIVNR